MPIYTASHFASSKWNSTALLRNWALNVGRYFTKISQNWINLESFPQLYKTFNFRIFFFTKHGSTVLHVETSNFSIYIVSVSVGFSRTFFRFRSISRESTSSNLTFVSSSDSINSIRIHNNNTPKNSTKQRGNADACTSWDESHWRSIQLLKT